MYALIRMDIHDFCLDLEGTLKSFSQAWLKPFYPGESAARKPVLRADLLMFTFAIGKFTPSHKNCALKNSNLLLTSSATMGSQDWATFMGPLKSLLFNNSHSPFQRCEMFVQISIMETINTSERQTENRNQE